jgi:hypothetical protein
MRCCGSVARHRRLCAVVGDRSAPCRALHTSRMPRAAVRQPCGSARRTCATDAASEVRRYHVGEWIALTRTDTVDTELGRHERRSEAKRLELLGAASPYIEALGPIVFGSSRINHSVFGTTINRTAAAPH